MFSSKTKPRQTADPAPGGQGEAPKRRARRAQIRSVAAGKSQRRTIRAGLLLVTGLCGIAGGFVVLHRSSATTDVYIATKALPAGAKIAASDLGVEQVPAPGISGALALSAILGHHTALAVLPGEVFTTGLATGGTIRANQAVIGISLAPGHMPNAGLAPGTEVEIIYTSQNPLGGATGAQSAASASTSSATPLAATPGSILGLGVVSSVVPSANGGATLVDLIVPAAEVPITTTAAANNSISLARRA